VQSLSQGYKTGFVKIGDGEDCIGLLGAECVYIEVTWLLRPKLLEALLLSKSLIDI